MMDILSGVLAGAVIGYLPGALFFRLPILAREKRAALPAEERVFWQVLLSVGWSLSATLALAAASGYSLGRLIAANLAVSLIVVALGRSGLRWPGATRLSATVLLPIVLCGLGIWRFFPASEYILGGKDPGVYVNDGVQIARTGALFRRDVVVARIPEAARDLFVRSHNHQNYYGLRFMGVFVNDPATGAVIPGFPHLYPASIAIGYGLAGTVGATNIVALWATLGLLSVYFLGARLLGRLPAFAATVVLALNVAEVWYGRYPNTEVVMQALLFATLLALARAHQDDDAFFGWVAGGLAAVQMFNRFDTFLAIAGIGAGLALVWIVQGTKPRWGFTVPVLAGAVLSSAYYAGPMKQYFEIYRLNLPSIPVATGGLIIAGVLFAALGRLRGRLTTPATHAVPVAIAGLLVVLAVYALFFRHAGGLRTTWDAYALRTFRDAYVYWPALVAAIAGYAIASRRVFWRDPAFFLVFAGFSIFFFYKIRIVPEQFWMARRYVPMILPGAMLFAAAAAFGIATRERRRTIGRAIAGTAFMAFVGWQYTTAAAPVAAHQEYRGAIRQVAKLAAHFTDRDLVIVESRNAGSDYHTLALPLAYLHGLQVLVLESPRPDRRLFAAFLADALTQYERVFFLGGGGTDLLSRRISPSPVAFSPLDVREYETTQCCSTADEPVTYWNRYPTTVRTKDLGYSVFRLSLGGGNRSGFTLDVGYLDDLNVVRFYAREVFEGHTFRWTSEQSFIAATGLTGAERELVLVMNAGGRPTSAKPATVDVWFNGTPLGTVTVAEGFAAYRLALPGDAVRQAAASDDPAELRLVGTTWSPHDFGGGADTRQLGVMIDRVEIH